jgi:hypothetical protein
VEPEGSIPHSQKLSTCPYPEPDHITPSYLYKIHPTTYVLVFLVASFPLASPQTTYTRSSSPPFVLHALKKHHKRYFKNTRGLMFNLAVTMMKR